ncbi:MAG: M28 family peptidase [Phycisphaeraceae bacterium]|nr:M28 family peptidase [Phycisphaeraceae bacterium]MCW5754878.1 M28 family peptidase [Phycisphaeraceae bacterium]
MSTLFSVAHCVLASFALAHGPALHDPSAAVLDLPAKAISEELLMETIRSLPAKRAANGSPEHLEGLRKTEAWLEQALAEMGYEVHTQEFDWAPRPRRAENPPSTWKNIWVEIPGRSKPSEVLIVGAHFDAVPQSPGADDNASGTAALLELARVLEGRPMARTVRLLFFNLEEVGLVGSREYVSQIARPALREGRETIIGMISLDGVGYYSSEPGSQQWPPQVELFGLGNLLPTTADFIALNGIQSDRVFTDPLAAAMLEAEPDLKILRADELMAFHLPDQLRSDHASFIPLAVPAIQFADTSNFRSRHYHQPSDTPETLDMVMYTRFVRALAHGVWTVAGPLGIETEAAPPESGDAAVKDD